MNPSQARQALVDIALKEVGNKEIGGNNKGPAIVKYQKATWLDPDPWPWCAAFVDWCIQEWVKNPEVTKVLGINSPLAWRPQTAGAFDMANWAKKKGLKILDENADVLAGDLIIFDFSHIGIVTKDAPRTVNTLDTVEGNTNGSGDRDSTTGDGVWAKRRARSLAKQFIRLV